MLNTAALQNYIVGASDERVRINLGCSHYPRQGYLNIDWFEHDARVLSMDPRRLDLPDDYADEILTYTLEHIPYTETMSVLCEWLRVLKPGGKIEITVPDIEWLFKFWLAQPERERWGPYLAAIFGLQRSERDFHYVGFTHARIAELLSAAGFTEVLTEKHGEDHMVRIRATATKPRTRSPYTYAPTEASIESSLKPIVAFSRAKKIFASPLPDVDYTWLCQKLEYNALFEQAQKMQELLWHYQQTTQSHHKHLSDCYSSLDSQAKLIAELKQRLEDQGRTYRGAIEDLESGAGVEKLRNELAAVRKHNAEVKASLSEQLAHHQRRWEKLLSIPGARLLLKLIRRS